MTVNVLRMVAVLLETLQVVWRMKHDAGLWKTCIDTVESSLSSEPIRILMIMPNSTALLPGTWCLLCCFAAACT